MAMDIAESKERQFHEKYPFTYRAHTGRRGVKQCNIHNFEAFGILRAFPLINIAKLQKLKYPR